MGRRLEQGHGDAGNDPVMRVHFIDCQPEALLQ
jgi:hypothetical protein